MSNPIYYIKNGEIAFGVKALFSDLNFQIMPDDRICLIGRNGCGKSTIMKIITNILELDRGEVYRAPDFRVGYLSQDLIANEDAKVYDYILKSKTSQNQDINSIKYTIDPILSALDLDGEENVMHLSGGRARKVALIQALLSEPDLLLLDEPTNHLDISAIYWLENYIKNFPGAIITISHDRAFLSNITSKTFWLDHGTLRVNNKGYKDFNRWQEEVFSFEEKNLRKLGKELDAEKLWRQQGVTARRKRNQRRLHNLFALREKFRQENAKNTSQHAHLKLPTFEKEKAAKLVLELENASYKYKDETKHKVILNDFSIRIQKGEKIGIVGKNGSGKSSFLKIINQLIKPDQGRFKLGANIQISYFDQKRESLNPEKTLWETLCPTGGDTVKVGNSYRHVVSYLKDFMFSIDNVRSPVSILSGGEANRLLLAKILANPTNFLILDEPTNDLDMDSLDMLEELLSDYGGTLIIVSHDRDFINNIVTRTLYFHGDGEIIDYHGGYNDTYAKGNKQSLKAKNKSSKNSSSDKIDSSKKLSFNEQREYELIPQQIAEFEKKIKLYEKQLETDNLFLSDNYLFNRLIDIIPQIKKKITDLETRWLEFDERQK